MLKTESSVSILAALNNGPLIGRVANRLVVDSGSEWDTGDTFEHGRSDRERGQFRRAKGDARTHSRENKMGENKCARLATNIRKKLGQSAREWKVEGKGRLEVDVVVWRSRKVPPM